MARPEHSDASSDGDALGGRAKRSRHSSDEQLKDQRRRLNVPQDASQIVASPAGSAQHTPGSGDDSGTASRTIQHAVGDLAGLDDNLMALLLPDGFGASSKSIGASSDQVAISAVVESAGPSGVERIAADDASTGSPESSRELLPVAATVAAAETPEVRVQNVIASGRVVVEGRRSASLDLRRIAVSCRLAEYNPRKINACIVRLRKPKCTGLIFRSGRVMVTGAQSEDAALRAARLLVRMLQAVLSPQPPDVGGTPKRAALPAEAASRSDSGCSNAVNTTGSQKLTPTQHPAIADGEAIASDYGTSKSPESEERLAMGDSMTPQSVDSAVLMRQRDASVSPSDAHKGNFASIRLTQFAVENIVATADCGLPVRLEGLAFDHKEFCSYEPELFAGLVYRYSPTPSLKAVLLIFVSGKVVITGCKSAAEIQEVFHSFFPVLLKYHT